MKGKVFNAQEVQSMIAGNKKMFREVIKNANYDSPVHSYKDWENNGLYYPIATLVDENGHQEETQYSFDAIKCPYQVGQKIFCKESWGLFEKHGLPDSVPQVDFIDNKNLVVAYKQTFSGSENLKNYEWKPARHMKQEHSRLTLLIKEIRVERLAEISQEDAIAEGIEKIVSRKFKHLNIEEYCWKQYENSNHGTTNPIASFLTLWNATHKKPEEKFEASPFVWCVTFELVK